MKAGVIIAAALAATAHAGPRPGKLELDDSMCEGGGECPLKPDAYLQKVAETLDLVGTDSNACESVGKETEDKTGAVYKCKLFPSNNPFNELRTFIFKSDFVDLNEPQLALLRSLYDENSPQFSPLLDPTYKEGKYRVVKDTTTAVWGREGDRDEGVTSNVATTEFIFLDGLPLFDRVLWFLNLRKDVPPSDAEPKKECTVFGNPSVSDYWLLFKLGSVSTWWQAVGTRNKNRAQNLYPSGDRLCVTPVCPNPKEGEEGCPGPLRYEATVEHMITTKIGGLVQPLYNTGLFDGQQEDAYLEEAQRLENEIKLRTTHTPAPVPVAAPQGPQGRIQKSRQVVKGPENAASESVPVWMESVVELMAVQQTLSRAINEGSFPAGLTATRCDVSEDDFDFLYVACSCAGQAHGLEKELFREGMAAVLNVSADRIDGITSSPKGETLVVRFLVGSVGYKREVDAPASCAERWAVLAGLVVTVLLLAFAAALRAGVLSFRGQSPQAEAGKSVESMEVEKAGPATEMEKTVPRISADVECGATETQGESA